MHAKDSSCVHALSASMREQMLSYGCTRLEIGLQSTYEDVARDTNRGHTVAAVGECFRLAKDAGFKVSFPLRASTRQQQGVGDACIDVKDCGG